MDFLRITAAAARLELTAARRRPGEWARALTVFALTITLFAVALQGDAALLARAGGAVVWTAAMLAMFSAAEWMFRSDWENGAAAQWLLGPWLGAAVLAKTIAHFALAAAPVAAAALPAALMFNMPLSAIAALAAGLLVGAPALCAFACFGAAATAAARRGGLLLTLVAAPPAVPALFFGLGAVRAAESGLPIGGHLSLLAAFSIFSLALLTPLAATVLRATAGTA